MEVALRKAARQGNEAALTALLDAKIVDIDGAGVSEGKEERHLRLSQFEQLARLAFRLGPLGGHRGARAHARARGAAPANPQFDPHPHRHGHQQRGRISSVAASAARPAAAAAVVPPPTAAAATTATAAPPPPCPFH